MPAQRLVIDLATGQKTMVDLTPEEIADRAQLEAQAAADEAQAEKTRTAREQLRTKARTDPTLKAVALALGLDPDASARG